LREIVLDTETTGLDPGAGHRVIEIGCLEMVNHIPTDRTLHEYLDPEREIPDEAIAIHGLTGERLRGAPLFADVADAFLEFLGSAPLVIHNAPFDLGFLNAELARIGRDDLSGHPVVDTLVLARRKFPGAPASLDALCKRFRIDNSARIRHGALLDAELLAEVYVELIGGRQPGLSLTAAPTGPGAQAITAAGRGREPRPHRPSAPNAAGAPSAEEARAHEAFLEKLTDPIWSS
jgi:DNA polymerase-3 subunit epsilon